MEFRRNHRPQGSGEVTVEFTAMPGGISQFSATFAIAAAVAKGDVVFAENVSAAPKCDG